MIFIVRGEINAGKTSWLAADFELHQNADGFICRKVFKENEHIGYDLEHLISRERCHFIRKPGSIPDAWREVAFLAQKYSFCAEGFAFAQKIAAATNCQRFYIDEIGPLELQKQGFYELLCDILQNGPPEIVIAVRSHLVEPVIKLFAIKDYKEINIV